MTRIVPARTIAGYRKANATTRSTIRESRLWRERASFAIWLRACDAGRARSAKGQRLGPDPAETWSFAPATLMVGRGPAHCSRYFPGARRPNHARGMRLEGAGESGEAGHADAGRDAERRSLLVKVLPLRLLSRPSIVLFLFGGLFAAFALRSAVLPVTDPDVFWLAAVGRDFFGRGVVPRLNVYGYADADHPWVMHEGLWAVLLGRGATALGPGFFAIFPVVTGTLSMALGLRLTLGRASTLAGGALVGLIVLACAPVLVQPRPSYASIPLVLAMIALAFAPGWSFVRAVLAVALELVWTNAHGSFPLGVVLLGVAGSEQRRSTRGRWFITAGVAALATLANPYGIRLHGLVDRYLRAGDETARLIHHNIEEFLPLWEAWRSDFASPPWLLGLGVVAAMALTTLVRRAHVQRALLVLAFVGMGVLQVRQVLFAVLVGGVLLQPAVDDALAEVPLAPASGRVKRWILLSPLAALVLATPAWAIADGSRRNQPDNWIDPMLGGKEVVSLVRGLPDGARVVVPFQTAGVVLWFAGARGIRVLFDPRNDCYGPAVARAGYLLASNTVTQEQVAEVLARFPPDYALLPRSSPVFAAMLRMPSWTESRTAGQWVAMHRKAGPV
jgi:hypothetical protein